MKQWNRWRITLAGWRVGDFISPMNPRSQVLLFTLLLSLAAPLPAADTAWRVLPLIKDGKVAPEWVHIGWGSFVVEGESLKAECDDRGMGLLVYAREKLGNCRLRIIYKCEQPKSNSGVYVRMDDGILAWTNKPSVAVSREGKGKLSKEMIAKLMAAAEAEEGVWYAVHHGFEVQIMDESDPAHRTGAVYGLNQAKAVAKGSAGEWRTMIITLKGTTVEVDIEGQRVSTFDSATITPPAQRKWTEPKLTVQRPVSGYIGLQNHDPGDVVSFKEVSVQPLK
jgi:hypothetical protein